MNFVHLIVGIPLFHLIFLTDDVIELLTVDEDLMVRYAALDILLEVAVKRSKKNQRNHEITQALLARLFPHEKLWKAILLCNDVRQRSRLASLFNAIYNHAEVDQDDEMAIMQTSRDGATSLSPLPKKKLKGDHWSSNSQSFDHGNNNSVGDYHRSSEFNY